MILRETFLCENIVLIMTAAGEIQRQLRAKPDEFELKRKVRSTETTGFQET